MPEVLLDGESVEFPGACPATWGDLRAWFESTLAERGRVLATLAVDGRPFGDELATATLTTAVRVEAASLTLAEALAQVGAALAPELAALQGDIDALANNVVRVPWNEVQERCVQLMETTAQLLQRSVDVAALAGEGSGVAAEVTTLAEAVERWMSGLQQRDAATVCLVLDSLVGPALERMAAVLREKNPQ